MQRIKNNRSDQSSNSSEESVSSSEVEIRRPKSVSKPPTLQTSENKQSKNESSQFHEVFKGKAERKDNGDIGTKKEEDKEKEKNMSTDDEKAKSCEFKIYLTNYCLARYQSRLSRYV